MEETKNQEINPSTTPAQATDSGPGSSQEVVLKYYNYQGSYPIKMFLQISLLRSPLDQY